MTLAAVKAQQEGQKNVAEAAGTILGKESGSIGSTLSEIDTVREILDSGEHNVGTAVTGVMGRGPIAQAIGSQFETRDAANTKMIGDIINAIAAEGVKALGTQPTDADLKFWTENKPKIGGDPEYMKQWLEKAEARLKNRINTAQQQVSGGRATNPKPVGGTNQPRVRKFDPKTGELK
jgi:hypothetical protein